MANRDAASSVQTAFLDARHIGYFRTAHVAYYTGTKAKILSACCPPSKHGAAFLPLCYR